MRVVDRLSQPPLVVVFAVVVVVVVVAAAAVAVVAAAAAVVAVVAAAEVYCINFVEHRYYVVLALVLDTVNAAYECPVDPL